MSDLSDSESAQASFHDDLTEDDDVIGIKQRYKTVVIFIEDEIEKFPFKMVDVNDIGNKADQVMLTFRYLNVNRRIRTLLIKFPDEEVPRKCRLFAKVKTIINLNLMIDLFFKHCHYKYQPFNDISLLS